MPLSLTPGRRVTAALCAAALCAPAAAAVPSASPAARAAATPSAAQLGSVAQPVDHVVVVSIDGLNVRAISEDRTPALTRLRRRGAATMNARTERELTRTLPNHTGMVTGRRIRASAGGHGVTWNDARLTPRTVQRAAGHPVGSVFSVLENHDRSAAVFASKAKFRLWKRSWDAGVDRFTYRRDNRRLITLAKRDLLRQRRPFTFIHLSAPDDAGHAHGFMTKAYLRAVHRTDEQLARLVTALDRHPALTRDLVLIVTADHGGGRGHRLHEDATRLANYRVPFVVWGAGVSAANLYDLNPDYANPGTDRTRYADERQPVRNGAVANLALDALGLPSVRGSQFDVAQDLDVSG